MSDSTIEIVFDGSHMIEYNFGFRTLITLVNCYFNLPASWGYELFGENCLPPVEFSDEYGFSEYL